MIASYSYCTTCAGILCVHFNVNIKLKVDYSSTLSIHYY